MHWLMHRLPLGWTSDIVNAASEQSVCECCLHCPTTSAAYCCQGPKLLPNGGSQLSNTARALCQDAPAITQSAFHCISSDFSALMGFLLWLQEAAVQQREGKGRAAACLGRMRNWKAAQAFALWRHQTAYRKVPSCNLERDSKVCPMPVVHRIAAMLGADACATLLCMYCRQSTEHAACSATQLHHDFLHRHQDGSFAHWSAAKLQDHCRSPQFPSVECCKDQSEQCRAEQASLVQHLGTTGC